MSFFSLMRRKALIFMVVQEMMFLIFAVPFSDNTYDFMISFVLSRTSAEPGKCATDDAGCLRFDGAISDQKLRSRITIDNRKPCS